jgi:hypothetical protein
VYIMKKFIVLLILMMLTVSAFGASSADIKWWSQETYSNLVGNTLRAWVEDFEDRLLTGTASDSSRGKSPTLWQDCPVAIGIGDPEAGFYDYHTYATRWGGAGSLIPGFLTGTSTTEIADWIQTEVTSGLTTKSEVDGGALVVSSEAFASPNDGLTVMYSATPFIPADTKTIWFEVRVSFAGIDHTQDAEGMFFVGLTDTLTSIMPSGVVDDVVDKIGFYHEDGDTTATLGFITEDGATEEKTTGAVTGLVDGTYVKLGFKCVMTGAVQVITPYVNGVAGTAHITEASLPDATGMGVCYGAFAETTTVNTMTIDWVCIAQSN